MFDDEDTKEIGIAARAEDVPRESGEAEAGDGYGMKAAKSVAPTSGESGPEQDDAPERMMAAGPFARVGEAEEKSKEQKSEPRSLRNNRGVLIARRGR